MPIANLIMIIAFNFNSIWLLCTYKQNNGFRDARSADVQ